MTTQTTAPEGPRQPGERLPKYKRDKKRYGPFVLTDRDRTILRIIYQYRLVQLRHVVALLGGSYRGIGNRLQGLSHHEYLERFVPRSRMQLEVGSPKTVYGLDTAGAKEVQKILSASAGRTVLMHELAWRKSHNRRLEDFLEHRVGISTFRVLFTLGIRTRPDLTLLEWGEGPDYRGKVPVVHQDQTETTYVVNPDGYIAVADAGRRRNFFLEIDRGSEEPRRIVEKFRKYWWYLSCEESPYYTTYENAKDIRVLVVTTDAAHMQRLMGLMPDVDPQGKGHGLQRFWFTHADLYDRPGDRPAEPFGDQAILLRPIWQTVRRPGEMVALFGDD